MRKEHLTALAKTMGLRFSLNSAPISHEEVFMEDGLFAGIARRADQLCSLCFGYGLGATFDEATGAKLNVRVKFDDQTPNTLRYLCIMDVLSEIAQHSTGTDGLTRLDELTYD
jgi:intracellular multiplication protein IcmS